jgi:hypothetical protein
MAVRSPLVMVGWKGCPRLGAGARPRGRTSEEAAMRTKVVKGADVVGYVAVCDPAMRRS